MKKKEVKVKKKRTTSVSNKEGILHSSSSPHNNADISVEKSANELSTNEKNELKRLLMLSTRRTREDYLTMADLSARLGDHEGASGKKWDDRDTAELNALIAQYESLRNESISTIKNRTQIMLYGLAAIAALVGGSLTIGQPGGKKAIIYAIFSGAIPLVCLFVVLIWASEAMRCHRVSYFLSSDVEARINAKLGRLVLTWEASLWARFMPRDELFGPSMIAMSVFGLLSVIAPIFGFFFSGTSWVPVTYPLLILGVPYFLLLLTAGYLFFNMKRLRNIPIVCSTLAKEASAGPPLENKKAS